MTIIPKTELGKQLLYLRTKARKRMKQLIIKNVPDDVHKAFKMACLQADKDMRQVIIEYMKEYVIKKEGK